MPGTQKYTCEEILYVKCQLAVGVRPEAIAVDFLLRFPDSRVVRDKRGKFDKSSIKYLRKDYIERPIYNQAGRWVDVPGKIGFVVGLSFEGVSDLKNAQAVCKRYPEHEWQTPREKAKDIEFVRHYYITSGNGDWQDILAWQNDPGAQDSLNPMIADYESSGDRSFETMAQKLGLPVDTVACVLARFSMQLREQVLPQEKVISPSSSPFRGRRRTPKPATNQGVWNQVQDPNQGQMDFDLEMTIGYESGQGGVDYGSAPQLNGQHGNFTRFPDQRHEQMSSQQVGTYLGGQGGGGYGGAPQLNGQHGDFNQFADLLQAGEQMFSQQVGNHLGGQGGGNNASTPQPNGQYLGLNCAENNSAPTAHMQPGTPLQTVQSHIPPAQLQKSQLEACRHLFDEMRKYFGGSPMDMLRVWQDLQINGHVGRSMQRLGIGIRSAARLAVDISVRQTRPHSANRFSPKFLNLPIDSNMKRNSSHAFANTPSPEQPAKRGAQSGPAGRPLWQSEIRALDEQKKTQQHQQQMDLDANRFKYSAFHVSAKMSAPAMGNAGYVNPTQISKQVNLPNVKGEQNPYLANAGNVNRVLNHNVVPSIDGQRSHEHVMTRPIGSQGDIFAGIRKLGNISPTDSLFDMNNDLNCESDDEDVGRANQAQFDALNFGDNDEGTVFKAEDAGWAEVENELNDGVDAEFERRARRS